MEKKYYPWDNNAIPQLIGGLTKQEVISSENTAIGIFTFQRLKNKVLEYLEENNIPYTQVIFSPYFEPLISEDNVMNYPSNGETTYNWAYNLNMINEYISLDLNCVTIINKDNEELLYLEEHNNFGLNLSPIIVRYGVFIKLLEKIDIINHTLPLTFGEYKKRYIKDATKEFGENPFITDVVIAEKAKIKK